MIYKNSFISFGGGVNSVAMTIYLFNNGFRGPVVFADVGDEYPKTYQYLKYFDQYLYSRFNSKIEIISPASHPFLYSNSIQKFQAVSISDYSLKKGIIPFFGFRWCTNDFKLSPLKKYGASRGIYTHLIGISADEASRKRESKGKYTQLYPLIEMDIDRESCINIIKEEGLEVPVKSGCFFCPYKSLKEIRELYFQLPDYFYLVEAMERNASNHVSKKCTIRPDDYSYEEMRNVFRQENPLFPGYEFSKFEKGDCIYCHL